MDVYAKQVGSYLLAQSWQIALLVVAVGLLSLALSKRSAHIRYLLWLVVLAKCLVPPYMTMPLAVLPERPYAEPLPYIASTETPAAPAVTTEISRPLTIPEAPNTPVLRPAPLDTTGVIVLAWLAGVLLFLIWVGSRAVRYTLWLRRRRMPLPPGVRQSLQELSAGFKLKRLPRIWLTEDIAQPFVWGVFRGSVYLPADFGDSIDPKQQRSILAHELNHIARFDAGVNLLQVLAQAIYWFHPLVWWANRKIRQEREKCCDEATIARLDTRPEDYSTAIVETLAAKCRSTRPVPSLAIASPVRDIEERIRAMMTPGKKFQKHPSFVAATAAILIAFLVVPTTLVLTARAQTEDSSDTLAEQEEKPVASLHKAALAGDLEAVKRLIATGADVNATDPETPEVKFTPLMAAANRGHADVAQVLLENGAEVDATDFQGWTALYYAFWIYSDEDNEAKHRERAQLVKALIAGGADVNKQCQGISPLINAITTGTPRMGSVEALLDAGADLHFKDNRGLTPLYWAAFAGNRDVLDLILERGDYPDTIHLAACRGDVRRVQHLIDQGTDANSKDEFGCTPLHWAGQAESPEVASLLIAKGAEIDATAGPDDLTPLMAARTLPVIKLLVSKGADIRRKENLRKLHDACPDGDIEVVEFLIDKGADVDARSSRGATPLWVAAASGQTKTVALLLEKGADINALDRRRRCTPLWIAVRNCNKETAELLIEKAANLQAPDSEGRTPLAIAKQRGHTEIVDILRQHGAKETLHGAVSSSDLDEVKRLLSEGASIESRDKDGRTPLHIACRDGRTEIAKFLIAQGADIDAVDVLWQTRPLGLAAYYGHRSISELLLSKGADVDHRNRWGVTALSEAASRGNLEIARLLLARGAQVDEKDDAGSTPLCRAVAGGHREMVEFLVAQGADIQTKRHGETVLHQAMLQNQTEMVRFLLKKDFASTALNVAAFFGELEEVKKLIAEGADIDSQDVAGYFPLLCAICGKQPQVVEFLVANKADVNAKANRDFTALHDASRTGQHRIAKILLGASANVNAKTHSGVTPVYLASYGGHTEVAELLLAKGADVNSRQYEESLMPLHIACIRGRLEVVELLLEKGADVNARTEKGETPLSLARERASHHRQAIVDLLRKHGAKE